MIGIRLLPYQNVLTLIFHQVFASNILTSASPKFCT